MVSQSSIESEYRTMVLAYVEIIWLRPLLVELYVIITNALVWFIGSISAQTLYHNHRFHDRMKHIEVDNHFLCDQVVQRTLLVKYVSKMTRLLII